MSNFLTVIRVFGLYGQRTGVLVQTVGPSLPPPPVLPYYVLLSWLLCYEWQSCPHLISVFNPTVTPIAL